MTIALFALLTGASCADAPAALGRALESETEPVALWHMAPLAGAKGIEILSARLSSVAGRDAVTVWAALGLSRRAEALAVLRGGSAPSKEASLGRALGLLALGDSSATATVSGAFADPELEPHRALVARALARMPARNPRTLSYDLLFDGDPAVREAIAGVHLARGSRRARSALEALAQGGGPLAGSAAEVLIQDGHRFSASEILRLPSRARGPAVVTAARAQRVTRDQLNRSDPGLRAGAIAAALRNGEPPASSLRVWLRRRASRDETSVGEAAVIEALTGDADAEALEKLPRSGIRGVVEVLNAFAIAPPPFVSRSRIQRLVEVAEHWQADSRLSDPDRARLLGALGRLDGLAALRWARASLEGPAEVVRAALETLSRAGRPRDAEALLAVAEKASGPLRAQALAAILAVCRRER